MAREGECTRREDETESQRKRGNGNESINRWVQFVRACEKRRSGRVQERKGLIARENKMKDRGEAGNIRIAEGTVK